MSYAIKRISVVVGFFFLFQLISHLCRKPNQPQVHFSASFTPPASPISWREVTRFVTAGSCCSNVKGYGWRSSSVASTPANSKQAKGRDQSLPTNRNLRFFNDGSLSAQWDACESFRTRKFFQEERERGFKASRNNDTTKGVNFFHFILTKNDVKMI